MAVEERKELRKFSDQVLPRQNISQGRDDKNWMKHTLAYFRSTGGGDLSYSAVHNWTLTNDVQPIPPKKRVY